LHARPYQRLAGPALEPAIDRDQAALANAHAAEGPGDLTVIVARQLPQADRLQHAEHGLAGGRRHRLTVEVDGHVHLGKGLNIVLSIQVSHRCIVHD